MLQNWRERDFLKELDHSADDLQDLLHLAAELKAAKRNRSEQQHLLGRNIALIFDKTSTRTRCAFEVGAYDQGARVTYLDPTGSQLGHKESIADTARVLSRFYDGIEFRGAAHADVETLAEYADVPVWNGLTDEWHPTQMLADFLTMKEHAGGRNVSDITYTYMGDARSNMGNSLLVMGAIMGAEVRICAPESLWPQAEVRAAAAERAAASGARIIMTSDPAEALPGSDFVHTDVWVSMGEPMDVWEQRIAQLMPYQVNEETLQRTNNPQVRFMHCLPAYHDLNTSLGRQIAERTGITGGLEVTDAVFESAASIVFDQAENRLHTIKAVMVATLAQ
jgi:ornithine carbamoyltransferase